MGMRQTRTTYRRLKTGWHPSSSLTAPIDPECEQFLNSWSSTGKQVIKVVDTLTPVQLRQGQSHILVGQFQHALGT